MVKSLVEEKTKQNKKMNTNQTKLTASDGSTMRIVQLNKKICQQLLSKIPDYQRNSKQINLEKIDASIKSDAWMFNSMPIILNKMGFILDGIHRVKKFLENDYYPEVVISTLNTTALDVYATLGGSPRKLADTFKAYSIKNYIGMATISSACASLNKYGDPKRGGINDAACLELYYSNTELFKICIKLSESLKELVYPSVIATCCYKLFTSGYDAEEYINRMALGIQMSDAQSNYHRVLMTNIRKASGKMNPQDHYKAFLFHFNAHVNGHKGSPAQYGIFMKNKNITDAFRLIKPNREEEELEFTLD